MNIFDYYKNLFLKIIKDIPIDKLIIKKINVETPKQKTFGDISFNTINFSIFIKKTTYAIS